jgi:hypothetical protein
MRSFLSGSSDRTFQSWVFKFLSDSGMWIGYVWSSAICLSTQVIYVLLAIIVDIICTLQSWLCTCTRLIEY